MTKQSLSIVASRKIHLKTLESEIEANLLAFVIVGVNLKTIRDERLYEEDGYNDFREYCSHRWGQNIGYAYRLVNAAHIQKFLDSQVARGRLVNPPTNERQVRPLSKLGTERRPAEDLWLNAWEKVCKIADGQPPTEKIVSDVVNKMIKQGKNQKTPVIQWTGKQELDKIYQADITTTEFLSSLPESSIDFIVTDPPYAPDEDGGYPLYEALGRLAARILRPGHFCAVYMGKLDLPVLLDIMTAWLDYEWCFAVYRPKGNWNFRKGQFKECWRPIGIFRKPGDRFETVFYPDAIEGRYEKGHHERQQEIEPIELLINKYTVEGGLLLEPFCGGGTVPFAAKKLGRHFLAFDKDPEAIQASLSRLEGENNAYMGQV